MSINYRTMQVDDYAPVLELWTTADGVVIRSADSKECIEIYLNRNPDLSFIAIDDGEIVGSIMSGHDGKRGYIQHLTVSAKHRSLGIGTNLVSLTTEALKKVGITKSHIHVVIGNKTGQDFWSKQGWKQREDIVVFSHLLTADTNA